jgi:hypothetical protein
LTEGNDGHFYMAANCGDLKKYSYGQEVEVGGQKFTIGLTYDKDDAAEKKDHANDLMFTGSQCAIQLKEVKS